MKNENTPQEQGLEPLPMYREKEEEMLREPIEKEPYLPYREKLHPRKGKDGKPYWHRTRSNPRLR